MVFITNINSCAEVTAREVRLSNGQTIPCGMVVWSTGVAPREFTKALPLDKTKRGQVTSDVYTHTLLKDRPEKMFN